MADRIASPALDLKRIDTDPAIKVVGTAAATGPDISVEGAIVGLSFNGLTFAVAPVEVDSASVTLAADLHAALVLLGLIEDVA